MANISSAVKSLSVLADATRREIFVRVATKPRPVTELADGLSVTRSAVSQHLRVLKDAGLVTETALGTRRIYRIDPRGIGQIREWLEQHWSQAMTGFKQFADNQEKARCK